LPTGTATATSTLPPTGTPTHAATATATATPTSGSPFGACDGLHGGALGVCFAYCEALDCDSGGGFPLVCRVLHRAYQRITGDAQLPCEAPPAATSCADMSGNSARMCTMVCDRCENRLFASSCQRLERYFFRRTGVALSCGNS
jgi:hypothetical protein